MTIVSIWFIVFVAAVVLAYYIVPKPYRWITLLAGSMLFYWFNSKWLLLIMAATALFTFLIGRRIEKTLQAGKDFIAEHSGELSKEEKKARKEKTKKRDRAECA